MKEQTNAFTAERATLPDALPLRGLTLIGTFGTEDAPGALMRLPGGRIREIRSGDNVLGQEVLAIEPGQVTLESGRGLRVFVLAA